MVTSNFYKKFLDNKLDKNYTYNSISKLLFYNNLLLLPTLPLQLQALTDCHSNPAAGHFGTNKTIELIQRNYYWPGLRKSVKKFIKGCDICSRTKAQCSKPFGLLHPLLIPEGRWTDISIDFVTDLPLSGKENFDSICVVKCRLTKQAHFIPTHKKISAPETALLFIDHIFKIHGMPISITSDHGPQFISAFWGQFLKILG